MGKKGSVTGRYSAIIQDTGEELQLTKVDPFVAIRDSRSYFRVNCKEIMRLLDLKSGSLRLLLLLCRDCVYNSNLCVFTVTSERFWMKEMGIGRRMYFTYKQELLEKHFVFGHEGHYYIDVNFMFKGTNRDEQKTKERFDLMGGGVDLGEKLDLDYLGSDDEDL